MKRWPFLRLAAVAAVGAALSAGAYWSALARDGSRVLQALEFRAQWRAADLAPKLAALADPTLAAATFISAKGGIAAGDLDRFPFEAFHATKFYRGIGWGPWVSDAERAAFEADAGAAGGRAAPIADALPGGGFTLAGRREVYLPVVFARVFDGPDAQLFRDLLADPAWREGILRARDGGRPAAAPPRPSPVTGELLLLVAAPVYSGGRVPGSVPDRRAQFMGAVAGGVRLVPALDAALAGTPRAAADLYLGRQDAAGRLASFARYEDAQGRFRADAGVVDPAALDGVNLVETIDVLGERWALMFHFRPDEVAALRAPGQWLWLFAGLLITGLIILMVVFSERATALAERRAEERTAELRRQIEARQRVEQSERDAAEHLRAVVDNAHDAIITIDTRGIVTEFNKAAERIFGYGKEEVVGRNVSLLMPQPYRREHDGYLNNYLGTGVPKIIGRGREVEAQRKDGSVFPIDLAVAEMQVAGARGFIGVIRDISERHQGERRVRELNSQLIHVSRLSAMGELASSLAHELNQPLTAVVNYSEACRQMIEASGAAVPPKSIEFLQKAAAQADRAGQIIRRLRSLVQKRPVEQAEESLSHIVEEASSLATVGTKVDGIAVRFNLARDLPPLHLDKVQIQQVVVNLVRNAVDALQGAARRELAVETRRTNDGGQEVIVRDTGPGIPPEVAAALFQPFVTSKKDGMGIGLSISRSIIEAHGGRLWAEPNEGGGTVFRFTLPAQAAQGGMA